MSARTTQSNETHRNAGLEALANGKAKIYGHAESLTNSDNAGVALLASILLGYMQVLWEGKPVRETAIAPYYAAIGEHELTPDSWDTAADLQHRREMGMRGQTNLTQLFIGVMIAAIIAIRVFIPTVQDAIAGSNASGTTKTILDLLSLFAALLLLVSLAAPLMQRT